LKVRTALAQGLTPIVAVGETLDERRAGATDDRVLSQTRAAFDGVPAADLSKVAIAYEPIWAIGTGQSCEPYEANRVMATIRHAIEGLRGTPILYGGSMTAANVAAYVKCSDINGGLVGGASLDPEGFAALIERAVSVSS
jgi:triosephosphate isomerase